MKKIIILLIVGIFFLSGCTDNNSTKTDKTPANTKIPNNAINQAFPIDYEIVESEDQSHKALGNKLLSDYTTQEIINLPTDKKMLYRIVVSPDIKENQVKPTIDKIISELTIKDSDIDEIILFLYSDQELSNGAYDVGTAIWAPNGELGNVTSEIAKKNNRLGYETSYDIKENLEEYLSQREKSEDRFGFTEEKRKQIFKEIVAAEDKAMNEADIKYPIKAGATLDDIEKNIDLNNELIEKYKTQVRTKYGITEDIESEIIVESFKELWAME